MSTMSSHPKATVAPAESIPSELTPAPLTINVPVDITKLSIVNVTTMSVMSVSELTALSTGSVPPKVATLPKVGTPPELATLSKVHVPPEVPTESMGTPPEVAALSKVDVPPEVPNESTETVPLEVSVASTESVPLKETVESTESTSPEVTSELTESVPLEATTLLLASVPPELINESTEEVPPEVTSESTESVPPKLSTLEPTESAPSEGTIKSTKDVPPEVTNLSVVNAPSKVTIAPSLNIPPESTTMSSVSDLPLRLTAISRAQSVPSESDFTKARDDARDDAIRLHSAFKGLGCDKTTIIKILAHRSATQRALIRQEYKTKFSKDLDNILSKELSGDLKSAVLLWMHDPATRDAILVKQGLSTNLKNAIDLKIAIEVICSRTPSQIERLKKAYRPIFGSYLEQDIESHAFGDNKKLLLAYVGTPRSEGPEVDATMVDKDAKALFKDGEYRYGTHEETFIRIFSERSWAHLAAVNSTYRNMYVNTLKKAVKNETSWNFKCALLTILQCAENPGKYFAKVLHKAMKGLGTDEETLSRVIVSRAEIDIQQIKAEFLKKYGKSLRDVVHSETSRHYRGFLISLLDTNN